MRVMIAWKVPGAPWSRKGMTLSSDCPMQVRSAVLHWSNGPCLFDEILLPLSFTARHMCAAARAAGSPVRSTPSVPDDDTDVQVCLTDSDDDSPTAPTAQLPDNASPKVVHGGRNIPLPPAVEYLSLKDAQAQDPECQEFLRLARTPRAAWPPHLRHTLLQFCVLHDLVYARIGDALPRVVLPAIFRSRAVQAHYLRCYGGHFGVFKTAARLAYNGPQFTAELLRQLCTTFGISELFASPYNPPLNSIVESYMRSFKTTLRLRLQHFRQEWDVVLPAAAVAYRCTPHSVTRFSPFFQVTGQELVLPLSRQWTEPVLHPSGARWLHALWRCRLAVLRSHQRVANANRKLFLEDPHRLEPGMHVALRIPAKERAAQGKFSPAFRGPYVVERVLPTGTTAEPVDPVSGTKRLANRTRLTSS
ncbi:hypothetical protein Emag_007693 [Eimeria magna]